VVIHAAGEADVIVVVLSRLESWSRDLSRLVLRLGVGLLVVFGHKISVIVMKTNIRSRST